MTVPEKKQMNAGVELLLKRMETHPEEFNGHGRDSKWESLVYQYSDWLDEEDKQAIKNALKEMRQQQFTEKVMEELVDPKGVTLTSIRHPNATTLGGQTLGQSWADTQLQQAELQAAQQTQIAQIRAMVDQYKAELTPKKHQTLYGKLKNYLHHEPN